MAQCLFIMLLLKELWHLSSHALDLTEQESMTSLLALIDVLMISNLLVMARTLELLRNLLAGNPLDSEVACSGSGLPDCP